MDQTLDRLQAFVSANPQRAFFDPPADAAAIAAVESRIALPLPASYRSFLRRFNGGFINISGFGPDDRYWDLKAARWNSNWLFGTEDLVRAYEKARNAGGWAKIEYIPFCQTRMQEALIFIPTAGQPEPPVLDAYPEASESEEVYPNFGMMLRAYVRREGDIKIMGGE